MNALLSVSVTNDLVFKWFYMNTSSSILTPCLWGLKRVWIISRYCGTCLKNPLRCVRMIQPLIYISKHKRNVQPCKILLKFNQFLELISLFDTLFLIIFIFNLLYFRYSAMSSKGRSSQDLNPGLRGARSVNEH